MKKKKFCFFLLKEPYHSFKIISVAISIWHNKRRIISYWITSSTALKKILLVLLYSGSQKSHHLESVRLLLFFLWPALYKLTYVAINKDTLMFSYLHALI